MTSSREAWPCSVSDRCGERPTTRPEWRHEEKSSVPRSYAVIVLMLHRKNASRLGQWSDVGEGVPGSMAICRTVECSARRDAAD